MAVGSEERWADGKRRKEWVAQLERSVRRERTGAVLAILASISTCARSRWTSQAVALRGSARSAAVVLSRLSDEAVVQDGEDVELAV